MEIEFIGVGEAFDPELGNSSYLIHSTTKLLVDCGYVVPRNLFAKNYSPSFIDAIYFTHFHADHTFGIPALLNRWNEDKRKKPLIIIGQPGIQEYLNKMIDLAYSFSRKGLGYEIQYIETTDPCTLNELNLSYGKSAHSQPNYAIKITKGDVSIGISGDGELTDETKKLFNETTFLVHEAFGFENAMKGHTTAKEVVAFARTLPKLKTLALVHIQREERKNRLQDYLELDANEQFTIIVPDPGTKVIC